MITIYHNSTCSKSRKGLEYLREKNQKIEIKEYLKSGISKRDIIQIVSSLQCSVHDIIRVNEPEYKELIQGKEVSDENLIEIIIQHPKLLQRPIVIHNNKGVIARPHNEIDNVL